MSKKVIDATIGEFLLLNGFKQRIPYVYVNDKCEITVTEEGYEVYHNELTWYSHDHNIYSLVGWLTWYDLIDKNYKTM
jgi:hypothetical protein